MVVIRQIGDDGQIKDIDDNNLIDDGGGSGNKNKFLFQIFFTKCCWYFSKCYFYMCWFSLFFLASDHYSKWSQSYSGVLPKTSKGLFWYCMVVVIILFFPVISSSRLLLWSGNITVLQTSMRWFAQFDTIWTILNTWKTPMEKCYFQ